jgi:copper(I)-binding protein
MRKIIRTILVFATLLLSAACQGEGSLSVNEPWARPGNAGNVGAAYFTINNPTSQPDVLLSADADVAAQVEIHLSRINEDGTMEMRPQENVPVPSGGSLAFEPGGFHVMLIDLQQDLRPGDTFELTLTFQSATERTVTVEVVEN